MHNKFCVIDFDVVIHGSFNWSKSAEYNKETVEVVRSRETAQKFAEEFKKLRIDLISDNWYSPKYVQMRKLK